MTGTTTPASSGSYASDSEAVITITFTVGSDADACVQKGNDPTTCSVVLWFGAHVAQSSE